MLKLCVIYNAFNALIFVHLSLSLCRLLFLGIRDGGGIYRIPVNGTEGRADRIVDMLCPYSMTLSFKTGDIYALDSCFNYVKSSKIDGSHLELVIPNIGVGFVYGSSMFGDKLFWCQVSDGSSVKYFDMNTTTNHDIFQTSTDIFTDVTVVHSSNQPSGIV